MNVLQLNLNELRTHCKELQIIIKDHIPTIIALHETNFKDNDYGNIKGYTLEPGYKQPHVTLFLEVMASKCGDVRRKGGSLIQA